MMKQYFFLLAFSIIGVVQAQTVASSPEFEFGLRGGANLSFATGGPDPRLGVQAGVLTRLKTASTVDWRAELFYNQKGYTAEINLRSDLQDESSTSRRYFRFDYLSLLAAAEVKLLPQRLHFGIGPQISYLVRDEVENGSLSGEFGLLRDLTFELHTDLTVYLNEDLGLSLGYEWGVSSYTQEEITFMPELADEPDAQQSAALPKEYFRILSLTAVYYF